MNGQKIVSIAEAEIGQTESPPNSNVTKYGEWFGMQHQPWCGIFVSWCYASAGFPIQGWGYTHGYAGCQTAYTKALENKEITTNPQPGDIVLFDWNNDHRFDHTGIFVKWIDEQKGIFESIEGNTSLGNDSNGGKVMSRNRYKTVATFIHPQILDK